MDRAGLADVGVDDIESDHSGHTKRAHPEPSFVGCGAHPDEPVTVVIAELSSKLFVPPWSCPWRLRRPGLTLQLTWRWNLVAKLGSEGAVHASFGR
jgi:hypothetical protein